VKAYKQVASVALPVKTLAALRRRAARETLASGRSTTISGLIRRFVEDAMFGGAGGGGEPGAAAATAAR
jgi:hypothetical protein